MENELLSISLIAEYVYCPRNFYYRAVEQVTATNYHMVEGAIQETQRDLKEHVKIGSLEKIRNVYLESDTYRIKGILDEIEMQEDHLYPIEYKKGESNQQLQHHIQLCLQGLLLEEATE